MMREKAAMQEAGANKAGASRRAFIRGALLVAGSSIALAAPGGAATLRLHAPARARRAVVAFHADQLYLDHSGLAEPYAPPAGLRSLDGVDEEALRHFVYAL